MKIKNTKYRKYKSELGIFFFLVLCFFVLFSANKTRAEGYDIYVDGSYEEDDSDGSSDKPYKKIEDALEEVGSKGKKIYIKSGTYEERISLSSGVKITGADRSKVIIKGSPGLPAITAKNDNSLKNITITGGHTGILFEGKGNMENCSIKSVSGNAISLAEGSGTVTIKNSNISSNGKGLYAQKGSSFNISGNNFENNKEEGIDIREKANGSISGNYIANNKEGGIEIVVGSSSVSIKGNTIKKNKASGIAAQFYSQAKKTGEIGITGNNISYNGVYGIVCKAPSGGNSPKGYYNKSLELSDNKIEHNKRKSISGSCKIIEAVTEEEEKKNQAIESATANEISEEESMKEEEMLEKEKEAEEEEARKRAEEEARIISEKKSALNENFWQINVNLYESATKLNQTTLEIKNRNGIKSFFLGPDYEKISEVKEEIKKIDQLREEFAKIIYEFEALEDTENKDRVASTIRDIEEHIQNQNSLIAERENKFSLFGWAIKIFRK